MGERPEQVEGRTFEEWVAELTSEGVSERHARMIAARKFGWQSDAILVNADGTIRPRRRRSGRPLESEKSRPE
jgi:hypothetical protein